jgi:hypothetical protein
MPNLSSLSMSMSEQRTSRRKFGTPTTFRKIGLPTKSVRLLLSFLFERRSQYPLVDLSCGRSACSIPYMVSVLSGQIPTHPAGEKNAVQLVVPHHLLSSLDGSKAARQKARSEQQESAQSSNKRARIEFASSTTSAPQRVSGTRSDANNPYLQHHSRAVPTAPPRKSRFGTQYGAGSVEQIKSGRRPWA